MPVEIIGPLCLQFLQDVQCDAGGRAEPSIFGLVGQSCLVNQIYHPRKIPRDIDDEGLQVERTGAFDWGTASQSNGGTKPRKLGDENT